MHLGGGGPDRSEIQEKEHKWKVEQLKRFVQAYREFLNQSRLWNLRAEFDVDRKRLDKSFAVFREAQT